MNKEEAKNLVVKTFEQAFDESRFLFFMKNLLNDLDESKSQVWAGNYIPESFRGAIKSYKRIGHYSDKNKNAIDVLTVNVKRDNTLERARTLQRNFIARHLKQRNHEAALVAFYAEDYDDWRFSLVIMELNLNKTKVEIELSPAKRYSFLVGINERSHTAQNQFVNLLSDKKDKHTLNEIEEAFNIETVTKEFFLEYRDLFIRTKKSLDKILSSDSKVKDEFENKGVDSVNFSKKLLGQIVFLYFLQKKGWFGVERDDQWGEGSKKFLRELLEAKHGKFNNFFNDILEPLFYEALRIDRSHDDHYYSRFNCKIPFLNGGLFDPIGDYNWVKTDITLPNELFSNTKKTTTGDIGDGILDIFDRYNFTVIEDEPLEKEVAIDPELLGKAYEKFNAIRPDNFDKYSKVLRSGKKGEETKFNKEYGVFYTPREIVHYMCQQSIIYYLVNCLDGKCSKEAIEFLILEGDKFVEHLKIAKEKNEENNNYKGGYKEDKRFIELKDNAEEIDKVLANFKVCDPAVGSGAFPVGMMTEIVKARIFFILTNCLEEKYTNEHKEKLKRNPYNFKRDCIENTLYGVDIDSGAVEITKLRLWLSLVVDEEDIKGIKPLPNLDYKIVCGNSLFNVDKQNIFVDYNLKLIEELKVLLFNETNVKKKQEYKAQIDKLITEVTENNKTFVLEIYFSEVFEKEQGGFDIVIANPPYVGEKGNEGIFHEISNTKLSKEFYTRWMDYFYYFFHRGIDLGKNNSIISFISTNYFLTASGGIKLRSDLKHRTIIKRIVNFNELKIFEAAQGQHNVITILQKSQNENANAHNCITNKQGISTPKVLQKILNWKDEESSYFSISQKDLYDGEENYIRLSGTTTLSDDPIQNVLYKIKSQSNSLKTFCKVNQGIVSGADKVSNRHLVKYPNLKVNKGDGIYVLSRDEIKALDLPENDYDTFVKPFFKNSDIKKYYTKSNNELYVLFIRDEGKSINLSKNLRHHFEKYKTLLTDCKSNFLKNYVARGIVQKWLDNGNYFVLFNPKKEYNYVLPKIVAPQRSPYNTFGYNEIPWYAASDVFFITQKDKTIFLKYILALVNSKLYYLWLYHRGKRKGETLELTAKPLSEIPIKKISEHHQNSFIILVDKILNAKKHNSEINTKELEDQIDIMVYKLYNLTYEESKIIDPNIGEIISEEEYEKFEIK